MGACSHHPPSLLFPLSLLSSPSLTTQRPRPRGLFPSFCFCFSGRPEPSLGTSSPVRMTCGQKVPWDMTQHWTIQCAASSPVGGPAPGVPQEWGRKKGKLLLLKAGAYFCSPEIVWVHMRHNRVRAAGTVPVNTPPNQHHRT